MAVSAEVLLHVYNSLRDLKDGEVGEKAAELAAHYGVSIQTVFRWAGQKGLRWRKPKKTKGASKVSDEVLMQVGAMLLASRRVSNEVPLPACDAKEMLEDSGIETGVSTSRVLALLREKEIAAKDLLRPSPHVTLLSEHPNHVWQFDVTNCLQYFLDEKGMGERDEEMALYKNKIVKTAKAIKKELLRYAVVDHCTGAFYFRYFYASGERAVDGAQFMFEAMRPKDELIKRAWPEGFESKINKYRLQGVPFVLVADRGSIVKAKANQALFEALKMSLETHMPGNPRAKGAVEGLMHILDRFEARLKFKRPRDLEEINMWALDWCIKFNAVNLMRGVAPRSVLWSKIKENELRLCPEEKLYKLITREPEIQRKANGARLISIDNMAYQIPDPSCVDQWVKVTRNAYEYPAIDVHFNGHIWLLKPIPRDEYGRLTNGVPYGEYQAVKNTPTQDAKKEMEKIAEGWGLKWKGTGDKRRAEAPPVGAESPLKVFGHQADKVGPIAFMDKKGIPLEIRQPELPANEPFKTDAAAVPRSVASRRIPIIELFQRLNRESGRPITKEFNQELRAKYGDYIDVNEAEEVIRQHVDGETGLKRASM